MQPYSRLNLDWLRHWKTNKVLHGVKSTKQLTKSLLVYRSTSIYLYVNTYNICVSVWMHVCVRERERGCGRKRVHACMYVDGWVCVCPFWKIVNLVSVLILASSVTASISYKATPIRLTSSTPSCLPRLSSESPEPHPHQITPVLLYLRFILPPFVLPSFNLIPILPTFACLSASGNFT